MNIKGNIIVIGDVMLDVYISGQAHRLSPEAPVPIVAVDSKTATLGGAGNVALNLVNLGCRTWLFGVKGNDIAGRRISSILANKGIEDRLLADPGIPTITKTRVMASHQQLLRFDEEKRSNGSILLTSVNGILDNADAVILSDYAKGVLSSELISEVVSRCKVKAIPVFIDPKYGDWARYFGATVITPNLAELTKAGGMKVNCNADIIELTDKLLKAYEFGAVLVTMGPQGMILVTNQGLSVHISSQAKEVFDVSGAGDTVIATLAACICSGHSITKSAQIANMAAGVVVGKVGTQPITMKELEGSLINASIQAGSD